MKSRLAALALLSALALSACGQSEPEPENADDFASRINGQTPAVAGADQAAQPGATPTPASIATTAPGAAPGAFSPGTATDPQSRTCGAPKVAPFFGRLADETVRAEVMRAIAPQTNIRFLQPGSSVTTDATSQRLNVMLDASGVIRDARCG